ncbi:MAG: outer membrane lipoprotein-sorting protein [Gammaproteobacteria bacterium]|nr:outer membrane lipoprotein-sorting protein [Gammaproteobacteria bacterium]
MLVETFFEETSTTQQAADPIRTAVMDFPLFVDSIAARDGSATLIVAELEDQGAAQSATRFYLSWWSVRPKELGYSKVKQWVDAEIWMVRKAEFSSLRKKPLKTIYTRSV